ncbi:SWI/SNF-related matrix-associated actin-dependent regulator of chromatin [Phytophthora palmivora]|uniref:SWI/SNF-related matrix-associated actin-dependent regulator of chromatin n=1 Tax=Phytophthora palmivora TaxID=4796 RepID=A0A2P4YDZ7_9STRA|nr:SWI/SNF-related matrix-associated actin-dependent regulator of chromatin [Phytophthora palmivora]
MSGGGSGDWHSAADRLALFMQRYAVADDKVARQLGWSDEQLRAYLSPEARRVKAASDVHTAVDKLLMRYRVVLAHKVLKNASTMPLKPLDGGSRRSTMPTQFGRNVVDRRSIIHADVTPAQLKTAAEMEQPMGNRKRKRRVIVQPLDASSTTSKGNTTSSTTDQLDVRKLRQMAKPELICPIRLDVDLDGVRFQDTFLVNAALTTCSPEALANQIAQDEKMSAKLKDAIAESIRRQILKFTSSCMSIEHRSGKLYPIYLDLIVDGYSLRDQFEWDISNDCFATQKFANSLCADLNLPKAFEPAIVFSIFEQVAAYRFALSEHKWIGKNPFQVKGTGLTLPTSSAGYIQVMPPLDDVVRHTNDAKLWQPVLSELSREERTYLSARFTSTRAYENRLPRPINPFIVYCQMQKEALGKTRRSASETRKIMGDMWRKCTEEEKEYYSQLTEVENEKRRRDHILDIRDRAIADWEEDEARRKGLLASTTLDASAEHFRGLLLENYMSERHEVDLRREPSVVETAEEEDDET